MNDPMKGAIYLKLSEEIKSLVSLEEFLELPYAIIEQIEKIKETIKPDEVFQMTKVKWAIKNEYNPISFMERNPFIPHTSAEGSEKISTQEKEPRLDDYASLNRSIKRELTKETFDEMPKYIQTYLLNAREKELKDTQIMYMSRIPWSIDECIDVQIADAKITLDKSHYGMESVKEKILSFISCQKHLGDSYGVVLLLSGPPGVGKTSIAKTIAEAMGREFEKISLAGLSDSLTLRGSNSQYESSKPGRIIESIIHAGTRSPLILLDEIDKMGCPIDGDPAYVLLDILDSDRTSYTDGFLEVAIDLSKVIFIATANDIDEISPILKDRMEVVELAGYTNDEKVYIVTDYIWPKLIDEYKIAELSAGGEQCKLDKDVIIELIEQYTNEPGVRSLSQLCKDLCRGIITRYYSSDETVSRIDIDNYLSFLSSIYYEDQSLESTKRKKNTNNRVQKPFKADDLL